MRRSFSRQFAEAHGEDLRAVRSAPSRGGLPMQGWPVLARWVVLAPLAIALVVLAGLIAFVAVGFAWMMGTAMFGDVAGKVIAGFVGLLCVCALLAGLGGINSGRRA